VTISGRDTVSPQWRNGLVLSLTSLDTTSAQVGLVVDYSGFASAYGADWADRLRLVEVSGCDLDGSMQPTCSVTGVPSTNNTAKREVSAGVSLGGGSAVMALTAGSSGSAGNFGATSLQASSTWSAGGSSGAFNWQYPMTTPPALNGPKPKLELAYSSTSVDGRSQATNNQPTWIGDGFDYWPGYVERRYLPCADDQGSGANNANDSGDQCWGTDNAVMSLNGSGGELVKDAATGVWRIKNDDASKVERLTDTVNADNNHEYWKVTTADGTQYFFGLNRLPGYTGTAPADKVTNSAWTVPVAGNNPGEDCHQAAFTASFCDQAWRWNLDYVVDVHGNTMSYFYASETNRYGRYNNPDDDLQYVRGGWLDHIDYGTDNRGGTDTENTSTSAPMRVAFGVADRCLSACWNGSNPVPANWTDTPWDQSCSGSTCANSMSPTFWTAKRLASITTKVWNSSTSAYKDVDAWTLTHTFPDPGDGTRAGMWLESIVRTGKATGPNVVGSAISQPEINFDWVQMPNRVDTVTDGKFPMNWMRMSTIWTDTGAKIDVRYSAPECQAGTNMPASPQTNTLRCYPVLEENPDGSIKTEYFHKYVVTSVTQADRTGGGPDVVTSYEYVGGVAWRHTDDDGLTKDNLRTWSDYRGYAQVKTRVGDPGAQSLTSTTYFRGMHGDLNGSGGTRSVVLPALDLNGDGDTSDQADAPAVNDEDVYAGMPRQTTVYNGAENAPFHTNVTQPWMSPPTASRNMGQTTVYARHVGTTVTWDATKVSGGWQVSRIDSTLDNTYGMLTQVDDQGDVALSGDEKCTVTSYSRNTAINLLTTKSRVSVYGLRCATAPTVEADVISDTRLSYDNQAFGATPLMGDSTKVEVAKSWSQSGGPVWITQGSTAFDALGRPIDEADVRGNHSTTVYTPQSGGPVTSVAVTGPLGTATSTIEPSWGTTTVAVDPNLKRTEATLDALGRTVQVWQPNHLRSAFPSSPSSTYSYTVRNSGGVNAIVTSELNAASTTTNAVYTTTYSLFDGLLRPRQTQGGSPANGQQGTVFTDTKYDARGQTVIQSRYFDASVQPSTTLFGVQDWQPRTQTRKEYDLVGRNTETVFYTSGTEQWRTTAVHDGNRVNMAHTAGTTTTSATTSITDARGRVTEARVYHNAADLGSDSRPTYDATTYHYDRRGHQDSITDNAGNTWTSSSDLLGRQTATDDPDKGASVTTYNDAGDALTTSDASGTTVSYQYDSMGRRTAEYQGSIAPENKLASWVYDPPGAKGQLASSSRWLSNGTVEVKIKVRGYTALYQSTGEDYTIPATASTTGLSGTYTFSRTFRANGAPATLTYPSGGGLSGETVTVTYDPTTGLAEQLQTNSGAGQYVSNTDYTVYGQPTFVQYQMTAGSWLQQSFLYDDQSRMTRATTIRQTAPQAVSDVQYAYDTSGNITAVTTSDSAGAIDQQCFGYDYNARLTDAWTPSSGDCQATKSAASLGGPAPYWQSWTFDDAGNRKTQTDHATGGDVTTTYQRTSTDSAHALTSTVASGVTKAFTYDQTGNTVCRPATSAANNCQTGTNSQTLTWTADGLLQSAVDGTGTSSYIYAADGTRLINDDPANVTLTLPGVEIKRTKAGGVVTANRYYSWNGKTVAMKTTGGLVTWLVGDHQGTQLVAVAAGNQTVTTRRQKPFGDARGSGGTWPNPKEYVGGDRDATGLVHIGARSYDPTIGSFVSVDPVFDQRDPRSWTGYAYASQTPVTHSDPTGLMLDAGGGGGGKSGDDFVTSVVNPMTCATYTCYQQTLQDVNDTKKKIEDQKRAEAQAAMNCPTQACHDQIVDALNSGQYDYLVEDGHVVMTDGSKLVVMTPKALMEQMATPPPPPPPAKDDCAWWKCALNAISNIAPILTIVALATSAIPVFGEVMWAIAGVADGLAALNSAIDFYTEVSTNGFTWKAAGDLTSVVLYAVGLGAAVKAKSATKAFHSAWDVLAATPRGARSMATGSPAGQMLRFNHVWAEADVLQTANSMWTWGIVSTSADWLQLGWDFITSDI
jgi:RHS repeat-associated protein